MVQSQIAQASPKEAPIHVSYIPRSVGFYDGDSFPRCLFTHENFIGSPAAVGFVSKARNMANSTNRSQKEPAREEHEKHQWIILGSCCPDQAANREQHPDTLGTK